MSVGVKSSSKFKFKITQLVFVYFFLRISSELKKNTIGQSLLCRFLNRETNNELFYFAIVTQNNEIIAKQK